MIYVIYNGVLILLAIGTTAFPIGYHVLTGGTWRRTPMGRHLMGYTTAAALLADAGIVRVFFPDLPGQEVVRLGILLVALLFVLQRDYILFRAQHSNEQRREDERTSAP